MDPVSTNPHLGIMESSTVLASACLETGTTIFYLPTPSFYVSGISAGSHSYDMCFGSTNGTGATLKYGYSTSNFVDATAGAFLEVWAAP
jgi:hypothetical protein